MGDLRESGNLDDINTAFFFNRPGVAGAVL